MLERLRGHEPAADAASLQECQEASAIAGRSHYDVGEEVGRGLLREEGKDRGRSGMGVSGTRRDGGR